MNNLSLVFIICFCFVLPYHWLYQLLYYNYSSIASTMLSMKSISLLNGPLESIFSLFTTFLSIFKS